MFRSLSWLAYIARRVCLSYAQRHSLLYSWPVRLRRTALSHSNQISFLPTSRQQTVHKFSPRKQEWREGEICEISPALPLVTLSIDILGLVDWKVETFRRADSGC